MGENHLWQEAITAELHAEPIVVTRTQLLGSDWLPQMNRLLVKAVLVIVELPTPRTQSGSRNDRRCGQRIMHWITTANSLNVKFVTFAAKQNPIWQLNEIHTLTTLPGTSMS